MCLLFVPCLTHFICIDLTPLPHFKQPTFPRTADSVVILHRLSVSLWDDPSRLHRVRQAADTEMQARSLPGAAPLMPFFESFKNIYPTKRWYTLNGASLGRVPPQLYGHKSGERELPHCSERPHKTERKAWLSHCDRLTIGAAAATPWGTKPRYDRQTKVQPEQTETQRNAETESGNVTRLNHLGFKQTLLILRERGEYYLSAGVNVLRWNSSQWVTAQRVDVDHESLLWQLLNLQAGPLHRKDSLI